MGKAQNKACPAVATMAEMQFHTATEPRATCRGHWSAFLDVKKEDIPFQPLQLLRSSSEMVVKDPSGQHVLHLWSFHMICL